MKNILSYTVLTAATLLAHADTRAQMPYNVTTANETYVPLTNATPLSNGILWSDTSNFTIPLGFNFSLEGNTVNNLVFTQSSLFLPALNGTQSGFAMLGTSLHDRSYPSGTPASPVQYTLSGSAGNRILKLEFKNAGFANEREKYDTNNDFINLQVWFYESNKSVEFRFGPSAITHFDDYFENKVPLGYMKNLDLTTFNFHKFYCLKGNPAAPGMDTLVNLENPAGFDAYPASGMVYRFTPKGNITAIDNIAKVKLGSIYPVPAAGTLFIESRASRYEILSVNGSKLQSGTLSSGRQQVSVAGLNPGMYLIRLSNDKNEADMQKFVKQ
jgi:hypothetical protein